MSSEFITGWVWLIIALPILVFLQRWMSSTTQKIAFLLTRHRELSILVYQFVFLPGVIVHEVSHWVAARLTQVRTVGFSIWPESMPDGTLRLGYVQTEKVGFIRESLIGIAPLVFGVIFIQLIAYTRLAAGELGVALTTGNVVTFLTTFRAEISTQDLYLWLYLLFAISNTMMPSAADRRAWPLLIVALFALLIGLYFLGVGPWIVDNVGVYVDAGVRVVAAAFTITIVLDLIFMLPLFLIEQVLWWVYREVG